MVEGVETGESLDDYINNVIGKGDEGSKLLAGLCAPTLKNCPYVNVVQDGMNGVAVLKNLPADKVVVVYSVGGDSSISGLVPYTQSMVNRLIQVAHSNNLTPLAFADVIDANSGNLDVINTMGHTLSKAAYDNGISILNGEFAVLGGRVNCHANIIGTMIALGDVDEFELGEGWLRGLDHSVTSAVFYHEGKPVYINSDGVGTKTEFHERTGRHERGLWDAGAMQADDLIKLGAEAKVFSQIIEYYDSKNFKTHIDSKRMDRCAKELSKYLGANYIFQFENVGGHRITGFSPNYPAYNISGSSVSLIHEKRLKNPLHPSVGDDLIAIRGRKPNPRSNGITDKRQLMVRMFGPDYHNTAIGKVFLKYLSEPSVILYPYFKDLINQDLATSVYHPSGGAWKGKLARPLAKEGLYVRAGKEKGGELFEPDWRELALAGENLTSAYDAYAKWPMGTDGFITTQNTEGALDYLRSKGFDARVIGRIEKNKDGKTGVELTACNGKEVYYGGLEKKVA